MRPNTKTVIRIDIELKKLDKRIKVLTEERIQLSNFTIGYIKDLRTKIKDLEDRAEGLELLVDGLDKRTKNLRCSSNKTGPP